MGVQLRNRAVSSLLTGIGADDVTLRVLDADADRFPALDLPSDWFVAALVDTSHNTEFIRVTARNANLFTVERGQEGTVARAFSAGDRVELRVTAQAWEGLARNDWHRPLDAAGNVVAPKLLNAASFALKGDWSAFFPVHRAVRVFQNADAAGYVASSNYEARAGRTVVTVVGLSLDAGLVLVEVGHDVKAAPRYGHAATADHATSADRAEQADSAAMFGGRAPSHYALAHHGHSMDDLTDAGAGARMDVASEEQALAGEGNAIMTPGLVKKAIKASPAKAYERFVFRVSQDNWEIPENVKFIIAESFGGGGGGSSGSIHKAQTGGESYVSIEEQKVVRATGGGGGQGRQGGWSSYPRSGIGYGDFCASAPNNVSIVSYGRNDQPWTHGQKYMSDKYGVGGDAHLFNQLQYQGGACGGYARSEFERSSLQSLEIVVGAGGAGADGYGHAGGDGAIILHLFYDQ